jgi:hypothetical protein
MLSVIIMSVTFYLSYADCYAECRYAECCYAEYRGALFTPIKWSSLQKECVNILQYNHMRSTPHVHTFSAIILLRLLTELTRQKYTVLTLRQPFKICLL